MRSFIILCCLVAIEASICTDAVICRGGLHFDGKYYEKEIIKEGLDSPYQMIVNKKTNILYFSYSVGTNDEDRFKSGSIDLNTNKFTEIPDVENGFAAAIDQEKGIVYLGGSKGITVLDTQNKSALPRKANGKNIWLLFFKDNLYFIDYPAQKLHVYKGFEATLVPEFAEMSINQFAVDKDGKRFFTNDTGLYGLEMNTNVDEAKMYDSKITIRGIALNNGGKAFFCGEDGVFSLTEENKIKHIAVIFNAFGLAFDKEDHVIYATSDKIIKLIPSSKNCTVFINTY